MRQQPSRPIHQLVSATQPNFPRATANNQAIVTMTRALPLPTTSPDILHQHQHRPAFQEEKASSDFPSARNSHLHGSMSSTATASLQTCKISPAPSSMLLTFTLYQLPWIPTQFLHTNTTRPSHSDSCPQHSRSSDFSLRHSLNLNEYFRLQRIS